MVLISKLSSGSLLLNVCFCEDLSTLNFTKRAPLLTNVFLILPLSIVPRTVSLTLTHIKQPLTFFDAILFTSVELMYLKEGASGIMNYLIRFLRSII